MVEPGGFLSGPMRSYGGTFLATGFLGEGRDGPVLVIESSSTRYTLLGINIILDDTVDGH